MVEKKEKEQNKTFESIMEIAASRGFFWPSAENYPDKLAGFFDYGQYGRMLKDNVIKMWRRELVNKEGMIEMDGSQILPKSVFMASGHLDNFTDPLVSCSKCKFIARADRLIQEKAGTEIPEKLSSEEYGELLKKHNIKCPKCSSSFGKVERWNLMLKTEIGGEKKEAYLRPETCQSIFPSFPRIFKISRKKLPLGIAQAGKVFRNEISPRQGLIRIREINQAEIEVFFNPELENQFEKFEEIKRERLCLFFDEKMNKMTAEDAVKTKAVYSKLVAYYLSILQRFYLKLGIPEDRIRFKRVDEKDRPFYAKETWDFEVLTSMGWLELVACNHRGDYDLKSHEKFSAQKMDVVDENTKKKVLPNVFELSLGLDRTIYSLLDLGFTEDPKNDRTFFMFNPKIAPVTVGIFPLVNKDDMPEIAQSICKELENEFVCFYDDSGSVGRRYRRQDEIGTPYCITVDSQTLQDNTVTVRERDNMQQHRIKIEKLKEDLR